MAAKLTGGDVFPRLALTMSDGATVTLPDDIETPLALVLFYRGHW
jgi:hypothetical protein